MSTNNTISPFIIQTMVMRLSKKESMQYLHDKGFKISKDSFYKLCSKYGGPEGTDLEFQMGRNQNF